MRQWVGVFLAVCLLAPLAACRARSQSGLPVVTLRLGKYVVKAEVAATEIDQATGLMYRTQMGTDEGMLFVFKDSTRRAFWMRNTYLPLTVAYLDDQGILINLEDMQPQTENPHWSAGPAKYALEMNQGWFAKRGLGPGLRVEGLDKLSLSTQH
jgi:uncharacterized membrane protein (UPF0127 family)